MFYFWDLKNLQEQVKKAFCYQKLFWPFTVWINCSSDLKIFENSQPSASNFKSFFRSLQQFFLTVGQNNFGDKIPKIICCWNKKLWKECKAKVQITIIWIVYSHGILEMKKHRKNAQNKRRRYVCFGQSVCHIGYKKMFYLLGFTALIAASKNTILVYVVCYILR